MVILAQTQTDADGRYRLDDLPAGRYFIVAGLLRALTYFPGVETSAEAQAITIASNSLLEGRDFRLLNQPAPLSTGVVLPSPEARTVSGRFVVEGGGPMPRSVILKHSPGGASFASGFIATPLIADATGVFTATFTGANGGRIVLQNTEPSAFVVSSVMFGADDASTRRATVITGRPLVVTFKSTGVKLTGRIAGGTLPSPDGRKVLLVGTTSVPGTFPMSVSREAVVGPDGQFTFSDVFRGAYEIRVAGASGTPGARVDVNDTDLNVSVPNAR
jgi:hypothetical protein